MLEPNLYTVNDKGGEYGLHKYKDSPAILLLERHACGDWFQVGPAKPGEVAFFHKFGTKVIARPKVVAEAPEILTES